jgi:ABC-type amino acid transport substrate-binding protein
MRGKGNAMDPKRAVLSLIVTLAAQPALSLDICVEGNYPPFSWVAEDGTISGFDIDIADAVCASIGETCQLVKVRWENMIPALNRGRCDAIVASMSDTAERRKQIDFTTRYYRAPVRFVGPESVGLNDAPESLAGKVVGVQQGTVFMPFMEAHYPDTALRLYGNQQHVLLDLTLGRVDAVLGEAIQLDAGFLRTPAGDGFAFFGGDHFDPAIQGEGAAIGVRKADTALRDRMSQAIADIRADRTYDAIVARYFNTDIYGE